MNLSNEGELSLPRPASTSESKHKRNETTVKLLQDKLFNFQSITKPLCHNYVWLKSSMCPKLVILKNVTELSYGKQ